MISRKYKNIREQEEIIVLKHIVLTFFYLFNNCLKEWKGEKEREKEKGEKGQRTFLMF